MKTKYMKQVYMGTIGDMKNLEQHYSDMAEKGWMIVEIGLFTHRYQAVEPCKKRFFVDFLPQITAFDYPENEDAQDYRRICEESGWNFIAANKQFHVFCADRTNDAPIPIHTDNSIHAKIYLKASRKYELLWLIYAAVMLCFFSTLGRGVELFLSNMQLFMTIGYTCFAVGYIWTLGFIIRWYIRTKKSVKNNLPLPTVSQRFAKLRNKVFLAGGIAMLVCMIIGITLEVIGGMSAVFILIVMLMPLSAFGVGLWIRKQIDTKRRTRAGNIGLAIVTIIIMEIVFLGITTSAITKIPFNLNSDSLDNRPVLTLKDIGVTTEPDDFFIDIKGTIAVPTNYEYWESNRGGSVQTQVYSSISKTLTCWLYDYYVEEYMKGFSRFHSNIFEALTPDEATFWGAEKGIAFYHKNGNEVQLLLLNGKTVLRLSVEAMNINLDTVSQAVQRLWSE